MYSIYIIFAVACIGRYCGWSIRRSAAARLLLTDPAKVE